MPQEFKVSYSKGLSLGDFFCAGPFLLRQLLAYLAAACWLGVASAAFAQLTAESLIGDAVSSPEAPRYSDVAEAIQRYGNRDLLGAQQFLESAKRKDSKLPPVSVMLAKLHLLGGNSAAVRPALEQTALQDGDDPEPYLMLAEDAFGNQRIIEAEALFDKAINLMESFDENAKRKRNFTIRAYRGRAAIAQRREKWEQAEADAQNWLKVDPENATAHNILGQILFMLDRAKDGYQEFVEAKKLNDKLPHPFVSAATMYERRGAQAEAMRAYQQAYENDPTDETTVVAYVQALLKLGDSSQAETLLKKARTNLQDSFTIWLLSGVSAVIQGDADTAEQRYSHALALFPSNREVLNQLALLLVDSEDEAKKTRARIFANTLATLYKSDPDANITLAWVLYQTGQPREASAALRNGLQAGRLSADASLLVAKMLIARERKDDAKRLLTSALANDKTLFIHRAEAEELLKSLE